MYPRGQFSAPRVPSQQPSGVLFQPNANGNLLAILQKQGQSNRVTLPEMYIGDEGAFELASFLQGALNITMLDLKGNNIGPRGFLEIFNSLRNNFQIKSLNLEWNRLGAADISGIEALFNLMSANRSITHLDLRNNKIGSTAAHIIANFIRNTQTLASLDLRWNELSNNGARAIMTALQENNSIVGLEIAGNGVSEDLNSAIQAIIQSNRDGIPHAAARRNSGSSFTQNDFANSLNERDLTGALPNLGHQQLHPIVHQAHIINDSVRTVRTRVFDQNDIQKNVYAGYETLNMISHLEFQIENERANGLHLKEDMHRRIQEIRDGLAVRGQKKSALEEELMAKTQEKNLLRNDLTKIEQELKTFTHDKSKDQRAIEEKSHLQEEQIRQTDKRLQSELLSLSDQNIHTMRQVDRDWNQNCEEHAKILGVSGKRNDENRIDIYRVMDEMVKSEFQSKDDAKELVEKLKKSSQQEYELKVQVMDRRMNEHVELLLQSDRKTNQAVNNHTSRIKQNTEKLNELLITNTRLSIENSDIELHNSEFELFIERQTNEYEQKDQLIEKLKQELNKLRVKDTKTEEEEKDLRRKVEEAFIQSHDVYNNLHDQHRDRISELEKTLRESNSENLRLRADFQRLSDLLTANLQKTTYQVFIQQKVI